ncbi:HAD domain-containing protein [Paracoccus sp. SY]|uniref:HAD domain-containing protein n=1 Tax=Paracoccus sp. SY TaxID=1330255 RepID=UPI000CD19A6A|nr:HAD domain-containing protein [Paracoccus sp. SY]
MSDSILFLDIDGPMIPMRAYIFDRMASHDQLLDIACINVLRAVVDDTGAKIVFNTTHNRFLHSNGKYPGLLGRFAAAGFHVGFDIHDDCHTLYPDLDRLTAIREWLHRHPGHEWIAFDDCQIDDPRAFLTDSKHGIGWDEYQHARQHLLGEKPALILM